MGRASYDSWLDPAARLIAMARDAANRSAIPVTLITGSAQAIPNRSRQHRYPRDHLDAVLNTRAGAALQEMRRVLKPSGQLLFVEHGSAPEETFESGNRLTPVGKRIGGGCHLNRPIRALHRKCRIQDHPARYGYAKGPRP